MAHDPGDASKESARSLLLAYRVGIDAHRSTAARGFFRFDRVPGGLAERLAAEHETIRNGRAKELVRCAAKCRGTLEGYVTRAESNGGPIVVFDGITLPLEADSAVAALLAARGVDPPSRWEHEDEGIRLWWGP